MKLTVSNLRNWLVPTRVFIPVIAGALSVLTIQPYALSQTVTDNRAPVLTTMTLSPSNLILDAQSANARTLTLSLVLDDVSTVSANTFYMKHVSSGETVLMVQVGNWTRRGNFHTGNFTGTFETSASAGIWSVGSFAPSDSAGNISTQYDSLEKLLIANKSPFLSVTHTSSDLVFDAQISANATFSQMAGAQTSYVDVILQDALEYDIWFVPYANTSFTDITFSGGISISQSCLLIQNMSKCTVTSSNNNQAIQAQVATLANDLNTFGYSAFVQPSAAGSEASWRTNYIEFPPQDFDNDGTPNEQDLDDDNDGVADLDDLFARDASETSDYDNDGIGDNADRDDDNDSVPDTLDAFPLDPLENNDNDLDGTGDNADTDDDNDTVSDVNDAFPFDATESLDTDGDGIGNNADNDDDNDGGTDDNDAFPLDPNETIDSDGDGIGNNADTDDDNDGVLDVNDAFTRDPSESLDTDGDGIGNNADIDDDNDGILDADDEFPLDAGDYRDNDQDGVGDNADPDDDNDGVPDIDDAFPFNPNESRDNDGDGQGNNADPDDDNDGLDDIYDEFPYDASETADFDGDKIGNNADTDDDNDGVLDIVDAFPFAIGEWLDTDGDGIGNNADLDNDNDGVDDEFDAFDNDASETIDTDGDGIGNNGDLDDDNDKVPDTEDAFPLNANESLDTDHDGIGNNEDTDDDGDRVLDINDLFPLDASESLDNDLDGIGDNADNDDDNDTVLDINDAFAFDASETTDTDLDGIGNNADLDDDNDGFEDLLDKFPLDPSEWGDNDLDGIGDNADLDDDNDGVLDVNDAFTFDPSETRDTDLDGIGNNADTDDDNDGVLDVIDAFPLSPAESLDSDLDGIGNNADNDDDNDGIVDSDDVQPLNPTIGDDQAPILDGLNRMVLEATGPFTEITLLEPRVRDNNLNPAQLVNDYAGPLPVGEHVVIWTAVDFAGNKSTLEQSISIQDTTAPMFDRSNEIAIAARGIFTDVSKDITQSAIDLVDGSISATIITQKSLTSGSQKVMLQATDAAGNFARKELLVNILPIITAKPTGLTAPGNTVAIDLMLSGKAHVYPVSVSYTVLGPVSSALNGVVEIVEGQHGIVKLSVAATALIGEQIQLSFDNPQNAALGDFSSVTIDISDINKAPITDIKLVQNNASMSLAYQDQGDVTLLANINDVNLDDEHQLTWQITPVKNIDDVISFIDLNNDANIRTFEFDSTGVPAGEYIASVQISERNTLQLYTAKVDFAFSVKASMPILSSLVDSDLDGLNDQLEGYRDSDLDGIPDYLDIQSNTASLPTGVSAQPITTLAGYRLTLGDIVKLSRAQNAANASVSVLDITTYGLSTRFPNTQLQDIHFNAVQAITNFNIENLSEIGESVPVVIPVNTNTVITADAVYRKFNSRDGWFTFVENAHNALLSAQFDDDGNCPQATSSQYVSGLTPGDTCIMLVIQDGGPNDGDLAANGIIKDPGVLSTRLPNRSPLISVPLQTTVFEGENVRVDASNTTDAENDDLIFKWTQTGGLRVTLPVGENNSPLLSFDTPMVNKNEELLFRLDVFDGRDTSSAPVRINIRNRNTPPRVSIMSPSSTVNETQQLVLSANVLDDDGDFIRYTWRQISGPLVAFSSKSEKSVTLTMPEVEATQEVKIAVFVSDSEKEVFAETILSVINVNAAATTPTEGSGGGSLNVYVIAAGFLLVFRRKRRRDV